MRVFWITTYGFALTFLTGGLVFNYVDIVVLGHTDPAFGADPGAWMFGNYLWLMLTLLAVLAFGVFAMQLDLYGGVEAWSIPRLLLCGIIPALVLLAALLFYLCWS